MNRVAKLLAGVVFLLAAILANSVPIVAQGARQPLITQRVDDGALVTLAGNTRPEATAANDHGAVAGDLMLDHMYLQLRRSPSQQAAVDQLISRLHDQNSPQYHQWLTADQIADQFGPADADVAAVSAWLTSHGFTINATYLANGVIDFSGQASAIREAFHTEIHHLSVNGAAHIANMSDPRIPAALAPLVVGVTSMNDFRPHPMMHPRTQYTFTSGGQTTFALVPGDLETIYNINPLYSKGIAGQGQTIAVVEDTDVYTADDWYTFRKTFGLSQKFPLGTFTEVHPQPSKSALNGGTCGAPGVNGDDSEAILDAEWSSAAAPNAAIVLAACADTDANFGGFIAMQNLLTGHGHPPGIFSVSYGGSETQNGAAFNAYVNQLYEIAVLQGVSVFVSSGDYGAAESDENQAVATHGINASDFASTPNNVAVGGTDFADTFFNDNSTYWSTTNGKFFNSALSYIPESPWDDSCASKLITTFVGYSEPYGANGFCNSAEGENFLLAVAGGGAPSQCATGTPTVTYVVSGTCKGFPKPFYQYLVPGNPNDGVRDLPDVSLFASNGIWGHYYVICYSDPTPGFFGAPCTGAPSGWSGGGGTSFSSPIMAGIQALVNQTAGGNQGNPNFIYYALAAADDLFGGKAGCNSTLGTGANPDCVFHDVTLGDMTVDCAPLETTTSTGETETIGKFDCYLPSGTFGVLSQSNHSYEPAYPAAPGWDFATGLGTVNAYNLVRNWPRVRFP
jgi:subtilase family serine protease